MTRSRKRVKANVKNFQTTTISYKYSTVTESWFAVITSRGRFVDMLEAETLEALHEETIQLVNVLKLKVNAEYIVDREETPLDKQQEAADFFTSKML